MDDYDGNNGVEDQMMEEEEDIQEEIFEDETEQKKYGVN